MPRVPTYSDFTPASAAASAVKRKNRREGGRAEQMLRRAVWRLGLRYRIHAPYVLGRPDLVFTRARVCVFVDGDFWHGRNWPTLRGKLLTRANPEYWIAKIGRNVERDLEQTKALEETGWAVLRLWESDILRDAGAAAEAVRLLVSRRSVQRLLEPGGCYIATPLRQFSREDAVDSSTT